MSEIVVEGKTYVPTEEAATYVAARLRYLDRTEVPVIVQIGDQNVLGTLRLSVSESWLEDLWLGEELL